MNCCCQWGAARSVPGEVPEFECYACPIHRAVLAAPFELCKRHKRAKEADGKIITDDGRTLNYGYVFSEDDPQLKSRIHPRSTNETVIFKVQGS